MSDEVNEESVNESSQNFGNPTSESWEEVGKSFKVLGESLASAFRTSIDNEENRERLTKMQEGLEAMINEIGQAIRDSANSPKVQQVHEDAVKAVKTLRDTGEETVQEFRPHLVSALRQVGDEIQKVIDNLEKRESDPSPATRETTSTPDENSEG